MADSATFEAPPPLVRNVVVGETITLELEFGKDLTLTDGGMPDGEVPAEIGRAHV